MNVAMFGTAVYVLYVFIFKHVEISCNSIPFCLITFFILYMFVIVTTFPTGHACLRQLCASVEYTEMRLFLMCLSPNLCPVLWKWHWFNEARLLI